MITLSEREQDEKYAKLVAASIWQGPNVPECVLISACRDVEPEWRNYLAHCTLRDHLIENGWSFKEVEGCWLGAHELSFLVVLSSDEWVRFAQLHKLQTIAQEFEQDAILYLDRYRNAYLIEGQEQEAPRLVGKFRPITAEEASSLDGYTYDPDTRQFYGII